MTQTRNDAGKLSVTDVLFRTPAVSVDQWSALSWPLRWIVMVRGAVLPMTVFSSLIGILMAAVQGYFALDRALALVVGLTFAHATNNLLNDWIDNRQHIDEGNYFRMRYGVHVLEARLVDQATFAAVVVLTGLVAMVAGAYLVYVTGIELLYLMLVGAFFMIFYTWPLKHLALGELSVLIVWGPLMTAGSYFVLTGHMPADVLALSFTYGIGPTVVILGKHIDKFEDDKRRGIRSLPVVIGQRNARWLCILLIAAQLCLWLGVLVLAGTYVYLWVCAAALIALPAPVRAFAQQRPPVAPDDFPQDVWPLWYAAYGFGYSRTFGMLMILGLLLQLLFD